MDRFHVGIVAIGLLDRERSINGHRRFLSHRVKEITIQSLAHAGKGGYPTPVAARGRLTLGLDSTGRWNPC